MSTNINSSSLIPNHFDNINNPYFDKLYYNYNNYKHKVFLAYILIKRRLAAILIQSFFRGNIYLHQLELQLDDLTYISYVIK